MMPENGCYQDALWEKIEGFIDYYCPVYYLYEYRQIFEAYDWYVTQKDLPYGGGYLNQPYLIMQYFKLIRSVVSVKHN
jgi:hypothetical protein